MSLTEFKSIFNNAAAIVRARLSEYEGIDKLLDEISGRIPNKQEDPRQHRELFFEPRLDAQQIEVPVDTAESAALLLHQMGMLRLWVRVTCPNTDEHEVGTILETDDPKEFESLAESSCDFCGHHHDLGWEDCETIYAINTRFIKSEQQFDYSKLKSRIIPTRNSVQPIDISDQNRCEIISANVKGDLSTQDVLIFALNSNQETLNVPSPLNVWVHAWAGPIVLLFLYLLLIIPIAIFAGERLAWGVTILVFGIVYLVIRGQVQAKLAPTAVQRTAMFCGFPISACCFTAGATGVHIKAAAGDNQPWWTRLEYGETSPLLIIIGGILFVALLFFVWGYDFSRGWLTQNNQSS